MTEIVPSLMKNTPFSLPQEWLFEREFPQAICNSLRECASATGNTVLDELPVRHVRVLRASCRKRRSPNTKCLPLSETAANGRSTKKPMIAKRSARVKARSAPVEYKCPNYKYIERNVYVKVPIPRVDSDEDLPHCECKAKSRDCSDDECINRMLMVCCPPSCPAGPQCNNSFPCNDGPIEPFKTENRGWGLRSKQIIQPNQFITEYRGEIINSAECERRNRKNLKRGIWDTYLLGLESDLYIDARFMSGLGRFLNHSCEPNTIAQKWQDGPHLRIAVIAKRVIQKGEEITLDYSFSDPRNQFRHECLCGSKNCRGYIDSDKPVDWEAERIRKDLAYNFCFECGEPGDLLTCSFSQRGFDCHRAFHAQCLGLSLRPPPKTRFMCPSHTCDTCKKLSPQVQCLSCVSAWCQRHSPFEINSSKSSDSKSQRFPVIFRMCPRCVSDGLNLHLTSSICRPLLKMTSEPKLGQIQTFDLDRIQVFDDDKENDE